MKATGIVRRVDDLGRIVIPKEIRRTLRIREGDSSQTTLTEGKLFALQSYGRNLVGRKLFLHEHETFRRRARCSR
jgi:AbrB family looped-hinge helix DNA binding protein